MFFKDKHVTLSYTNNNIESMLKQIISALKISSYFLKIAEIQ